MVARIGRVLVLALVLCIYVLQLPAQAAKNQQKLHDEARAIATRFREVLPFEMQNEVLKYMLPVVREKMNILASKREKHSLQGHDLGVTCAAYSPDGNMIVSSSLDNFVRVWDARTLQLEKVLSDHRSSVRCVAYHPKGESFATGSNDGTMKIWDATSYRCIKTYTGKSRDTVLSIQYSPDGKVISFTNSNEDLVMLDLVTEECLIEKNVNQFVYTPRGDRIVISTKEHLYGYDLQSGGRLVFQPTCVYRDDVSCLAFSPDGRTMVSGSSDGTLLFWDIYKKKLLQTFSGLSGKLCALNFDATGKMLALGCKGGDIYVLDMQTFKMIPVGKCCSDVSCVVFSPDQKTILSASGGIKIWNNPVHIKSLIKDTKLTADQMLLLYLFSQGNKRIVDWLRSDKVNNYQLAYLDLHPDLQDIVIKHCIR